MAHNEGNPQPLANPFGSPSSSPGFIAFHSSTPVGSPRVEAGGGQGGSQFKPRRGGRGGGGRAHLRGGNWDRFGAFQDQQKQHLNGSSPHMGYGRGHHTPNQGSWRDSGRGGHPFGSPRGDHRPFRFQSGNRRGGGGYEGRGYPKAKFHSGSFQREGRNHNTSSGAQSYFHPSMLEDPWARFESAPPSGSNSFRVASDCSIATAPSSNDDNYHRNKSLMSDSMIAQVGDSFFQRNLNPAPEVNGEDDKNDENDRANLTTSMISAPNDVNNSAQDLPDTSLDTSLNTSSMAGLDLKRRSSLSDSMIPLVGDSVLVDERTPEGNPEDNPEDNHDVNPEVKPEDNRVAHTPSVAAAINDQSEADMKA